MIATKDGIVAPDQATGPRHYAAFTTKERTGTSCSQGVDALARGLATTRCRSRRCRGGESIRGFERALLNALTPAFMAHRQGLSHPLDSFCEGIEVLELAVCERPPAGAERGISAKSMKERPNFAKREAGFLCKAQHSDSPQHIG